MVDSNRKVWFITGASKGLGFEIARAALLAGDYVAATFRKEKISTIQKLENNPRFLELMMDVTEQSEVKIAVDKAFEHFGRLDVVVNNAGYCILAAIEEASDLEARKQYDTNVFGVLNVLRVVLPYLRQQRSGHIINMSSLLAFDAVPGWGLYASTKLAIEGISMGLSKELAPFGIKVTIVEPGFFTTGLTSKTSYERATQPICDYRETMVGYIKLETDNYHGNEPGDPSKLADIVVRLSKADRIPLYLPVGADSIAKCEAKARQMAVDLDAWRIISAHTNHGE